MDPPHPALDIGDPFYFFLRQANKLVPRCELPAEFISEAAYIIRGAFDEQWIRTEIDVKPRYGPLSLATESRRDIPSAFATAGDAQVVLILELAIYVKRLLHTPGLMKVIQNMRQYFHSGLLQLAYAYRFRRIGATGIILEPEAEKGRQADISFQYHDSRYLVECYQPQSRILDTSQELQFAIKPVFNAMGDRKLRLCIRLKSSITSIDRKRIQKLIAVAVENMGEASELALDDRSASISINDIKSMQRETDFPTDKSADAIKLYGNADWGIHQFGLPTKDIDELRLGFPRRPIGSRVFVWMAPDEKREQTLDERLAELERKISKKFSQTRRADDPARILIVGVPEAATVSRETDALFRSLQRRLIQRHRGVAAVIMTHRTWTRRHRYFYATYLLEGQSQHLLNPQVFRNLKYHEKNSDVLDDWH